jgi:uncharacterized membrane protein YoaK (UPF0700 family)
LKLFDTILFVLLFCSFIIGASQAVVVGIAESYWIFMISLMLLFLYGYRKNKREENEPRRMINTKGKKPNKKKNG